MATTKEQRMQAIRDRRAKEEAAQAAHTREFDRRTAETNKRIAERNRQRDLEANKTVIPPFNPAFVDRTNVTYNNSTQDGGRNRPNVPPIHNNLSQDGGRYSSNTSPLYNNLSQDGGRNQATSSVTPMSPAEEAVVDNDIELARIQQAMSGVDVNPEFVQRAMQNANANGDTRVTPQTLAGTPSIMDRMSQWGDDVWDSFFDDEIGDASVAQAKQEINPIAEGDIGNQEYKGPADEGLGTVSIYGPLKGAKVAGSFIKSAFTAGKNAYKNRPKPQPIVEKHVNPTPLLPAPKPVVVPRIGNNMPSTVVKQSINTGKNVVPRNMNRWGEPMQRYAPKPKIGPGVPTIAAVTNQQEPPMGPTIDITYKPDDVVPVVPPVDMPQNGGPDRGGYPNKARLPNNANAAPQRPGYKVVKSGDGSPVKAGGGGYMWSKDYQHPIWSQEGIWKQGGNG